MRYGKEINGGAELLCRMIAERMTRHWQVEVLTTCAVDYVRWKNELPAGIETIQGVTVRRFPVSRERYTRCFDFVYDILALNLKWLNQKKHENPKLKEMHPVKAFLRSVYCLIFGPDGLGPVTERLWMWLQGPSSRELRHFISQNKNQYDGFIFFTNTYATTYDNLATVADRAIVVPAAHDEPCLYFKLFDKSTRSVKALVYSTPEEKKLFERRFPGVDAVANRVTGIGVEKCESGLADRFRAKYGIVGDYVVYVGRIEEGKGCHTLFDYFLAFTKQHNSDLKLVLIGKPAMPIPQDPGILGLGFVSEEDKFDAIAGAVCLIMPSPYESLSIVLLEAWMSRIPVIVNGQCEVLKGQCERAQGGLAYTTAAEFDQALTIMLTDKYMAAKMAESGKDYTEKTYIWAKIEQDYRDVLDIICKN